MQRWMLRFFIVQLLMLAAASASPADVIRVRMDSAVELEPQSGRVIVCLIIESGLYWEQRSPLSAPFFESPQPILSIAVDAFGPGSSVELSDQAGVMFGGPLDALHGRARVQAIFDYDTTERSHEQGLGNVFSDVVDIEFTGEDEEITLALTHRVRKPELPIDKANLRWVEFRSEMLSEFYGRDVYHRAGVALPPGYLDESHHRREWPALYVIPGFGARHEMAWGWAHMYEAKDIEDMAPIAVAIVLDPESPLGHHGFVDSPNHGPRGTAFVEELVPHLEQEFRLVAKPEARLLTGHSSGGWSSLWLQLHWPEVFGACWSSAPDPIDFHAFQMIDLYADENAFVMADGSPTPSFRIQTDVDEEHVAMSVREEIQMEHALHPQGGSGQQWDAWMAMFSPKDPATGFPKRLIDAKTGTVDREAFEHWKSFDITRLVAEDWSRYGPIITERVRLACGELDDYYLHRAVKRFRDMVRARHAEQESTPGDGYIDLYPNATHGSIMSHIVQRWNREMRAYLQQRGLQDSDAADADDAH